MDAAKAAVTENGPSSEFPDSTRAGSLPLVGKIPAAEAELPGAAIRIVVPGQPDVQVQFSSIVGALPSILDSFKKPKSIGTQILKDYLPALTPAAAVFVSLLAFYYTSTMSARTAASTLAETLGKLVTEVATKCGPNCTPDQIHAQTVEAMKLAAYGEQALPAVKIVLSASDPYDRDAGVQVAKQMYIADTVKRQTLTREMLDYYNNAALRLGVLEWFASIESLSPPPLSLIESQAVLSKLSQTFGAEGERCEQQGKDLARATAHFLSAWSSVASKQFVKGMIDHCPKEFVGAQNELEAITYSDEQR